MRHFELRLIAPCIASLALVCLAVSPSFGTPTPLPDSVGSTSAALTGAGMTQPCSGHLAQWVAEARAQGLGAQAANVVGHIAVLDCRRQRPR
jgi:hypothetical protein